MTPLPKPLRALARPIPLALLLASATAIPVLVAAALVVQIALGAVPDSSLRLMAAPASLFSHALAGATFGLAGPLQFLRALGGRFGRLHRLAGWLFVGAGLILGASALSLLAQIASTATPLLDLARALAGAALIGALILGLVTREHRAWMIRSYALGMGSGTVALVYFPLFVLTGTPPTGLTADLIMVACWALTLAAAETLIHRLKGQP